VRRRQGWARPAPAPARPGSLPEHDRRPRGAPGPGASGACALISPRPRSVTSIRGVRCAGFVVSALLVAACGETDPDPVPVTTRTVADLALVPVPASIELR